jgi:hypothetical protein
MSRSTARRDDKVTRLPSSRNEEAVTLTSQPYRWTRETATVDSMHEY